MRSIKALVRVVSHSQSLIPVALPGLDERVAEVFGACLGPGCSRDSVAPLLEGLDCDAA